MLNAEILWAEVKSQIIEACNAWFVEQCHNPFERMYFYYMRSTETETARLSFQLRTQAMVGSLGGPSVCHRVRLWSRRSIKSRSSARAFHC